MREVSLQVKKESLHGLYGGVFLNVKMLYANVLFGGQLDFSTGRKRANRLARILLYARCGESV
jgi:hypothetical protein